MHEGSIAEALLEAAAGELAAQGGGGRITSLRVTVGVLAGVNPDALRFAFEMLAPGGPAAGAELVIDEEPARCRCRGCGGTGEVRDPFAPCPRCGSLEVTIEGGRELLLSSLEVELDDPSPAGTGGEGMRKEE